MSYSSRSISLREPNYTLLLLFGLLVVFGLIMLTSASAPIGHQKFGDNYFFIKRQILFGVLPGLAVFWFLLRRDYRFLLKWSFPVYLFSLFLLVLVFISGVGTTLNTNAKSWIYIWHYSIQPAEFAKLGLIIFFASALSRLGANIRDFKQGFFPALAIGLLPVGLIVLQPDVGTATIFFVIIFSMLFAAGADWKHIVLLIAVGVMVIFLLIFAAPYRLARFTTFLHPELDPQGIGYQINQSYMAIGSGGIFGLGLGHSRQKFQYLPEVNADSIFAILAEEMGFVIAAGFVALIAAITVISLRTAGYAPDSFGKLLIVGIVSWIASQSFFNIGAMIGILPLTGIPLPFVSHGGTALFILFSAIGILINVSKYSRV